jgi:hypothetical protein
MGFLHACTVTVRHTQLCDDDNGDSREERVVPWCWLSVAVAGTFTCMDQPHRCYGVIHGDLSHQLVMALSYTQLLRIM